MESMHARGNEEKGKEKRRNGREEVRSARGI